MDDAPESLPDEEPTEVEIPKTGAEAWKARRAQILDRNSAAHDRAKKKTDRPDRGDNRVADQRRENAGREAAQLRSMHGNMAKKRSRG